MRNPHKYVLAPPCLGEALRREPSQILCFLKDVLFYQHLNFGGFASKKTSKSIPCPTVFLGGPEAGDSLKYYGFSWRFNEQIIQTLL